MSDFYDRLTAQCKSSVVDANTIASQMGINTMTATSACSDSYTYTTTTEYAVPAGMLPGSGSTPTIYRAKVYRAKAEGKDTNMPIYTNNELRKIFFGWDEKSSDTAGYPAPKPVKVETYNDRVVKVTFEDGSFTKSVCSDNDTFDLDVGITICILKRAMGKNGHKLYNNMMRDIHKIMDENEKDKEKASKDKAERKAKQRKTELKAAAKKAKARQDQIDIQKTAFVEALRVSGIGSGDDLK